MKAGNHAVMHGKYHLNILRCLLIHCIGRISDRKNIFFIPDCNHIFGTADPVSSLIIYLDLICAQIQAIYISEHASCPLIAVLIVPVPFL